MTRQPADRRWLIEHMIPEGEVVLLGADGGSGKSLLALQLAFSAMAGRPFIGQEPARRFRTLILSAEDDEDEIARRLHRIARAEYPFSHDDLMREVDGMCHVIDATREVDPKLATFDSERGVRPTPMYRRLKASIAEHGADLVVIDSAADVFEEEIDRYAVRSFIRLLRGLGCAVLLLAHPSVDAMRTGRGYSGSTHWNNAIRARLYLRRDSEDDAPDARILEMAKSNYGPTGNKINLTWEDGRFVPHIPGVDDAATQIETERTFLGILAEYTDQGRAASPVPRANNFAPRMMSKHPKAEGLTRDQLHRAMEHLLSAGRLRVEEYGRPANRHQRLVLT
jgi:RecA-family ATPase